MSALGLRWIKEFERQGSDEWWVSGQPGPGTPLPATWLEDPGEFHVRLLMNVWLALTLTACEGSILVGEELPPDESLPGSGLSGQVPGDLPCEVATVLGTQCTSCHGAPLSGGAPFAIASRADLLRITSSGETVVARSVARMKDLSAPMPPSPFPAPSAAAIATLEQWVVAGTPGGTCAQVPDAGPPPLTCVSNSTWGRGNKGSHDMNPGLACQACHLGQNVLGQNPQRVSEPEKAWLFMGTVFAGPNEKDLCNAGLAGTVEIEIIGADGRLITRMQAHAGSGNFASDGERPWSDRLLRVGARVSMPYTVRVKAGGRSREMKTPQRSGDCNLCHTERGAEGAPGRVVVP